MELAKEISQVLLAALDITRYYQVEDNLELRVNTMYEKVIAEGLIEPLKDEATEGPQRS